MSNHRKTRKEIVKELFQYVQKGEYCALLGPPRRGKTRVLGKLHEYMVSERKHFPKHIPQSVFIDLADRPEDKPWTNHEIINRICKDVELRLAFPKKDVLLTEKQIVHALEWLISCVKPRLVVLLSHIESAGEDVARDLLQAFRTIHDHGSVRRPGLIVGGTLNLLHLTEGETSPFNVARQYFLEPCTRSEAREALEHMVNESGIAFLTEDVAEEICELTDGYWDLMWMLIVQIKHLSSTPQKNHLVNVLDNLKNVFSSARVVNIKDSEYRKKMRSEPDFAPVFETMQAIENRPSWLDLVARCRDRGPVLFGGGRIGPEMCLAFRREGNGFTFANRLFELVLKSHFTPLHIADSLVLCGRWPEAREYYELAHQERTHGLFKLDHYTMTDLVYCAFAAVNPEEGEHKVIEAAVEIAQRILGFRCVSILEARRPAEIGEWNWKYVTGRSDKTSGCKECLMAQDLVFKWAEHSRRHNEPARLVGSRVLISTKMLADSERCLCLCTANQQCRLSEGQQRAVQMLLNLCVRAVEEAQRIANRNEEINQQARQLALVDGMVARTVQAPWNVKQTVRAVIRNFKQAGFPHVMISLLDRQHNLVSAIDASGDMQPLVKLTKRFVHGRDITTEDDVLIYVIKTGKRLDIPDCFDPKYRCDQFAIRSIDPPLKQQIVFPLEARKGVGWPKTKVFGTVQIGRPPSLPLNPHQEVTLNRLVQYASLSINEAALFQELERLVQVRESQLKMMVRAGKAADHLQNMDQTLEMMLTAAVKNLGADIGSIRLYDPVFKCLTYRAVVGPLWKPKHIRTIYPIDKNSTAGWVFMKKQAIVNYDVSTPGIPYRKIFKDIKSNCGVPIRVGEKVEGVLVLDSACLGAFTREDVDLLEAFAGIIGSFINGGRAFTIDSVRSKLTEVFMSEDRWEKKLEHVVRVAKDAVLADHCAIFLKPDSGDQGYVLRAATSLSLSKDIGHATYLPGQGRTGWVIKHCKPLRDRAEANIKTLRKIYGTDLKRYGLHRDYKKRPHRNFDYLAIPILGSDQEIWGVLRSVAVFKDRPSQFFSSDAQVLLEKIGDEVGRAVEYRRVEMVRDRLRGEAAHQMDAPVQLALAYLNDMEVLPNLTSKGKSEYVRDAKDALETALQRFTRVRNWEKLQSGTVKLRKRNILLRPILESIRAELKERLQKAGIIFRLSCSPEITVHAYSTFLQEILYNLIDNGINFTRDHIDVRCRTKRDGTTIIEIRDNGRGLSKIALTKCFEPHFTLLSKRRGASGLGLGLPIAREIARLHGGDVRGRNIHSHDKCRILGAVFTVNLPGRR